MANAKKQAPAQAGSGSEVGDASSPPPPKSKGGRPKGSDGYTEAIGDRICELLAQGRTLNSICKANLELPPESTIRGWALEPEHPFYAKYARARLLGYHKMADQVLDVADDSSGDIYWDEDGNEKVSYDNIQRAKLRVDTRKWLLSKALPKIYGDKIQVDGDAEGGPIKIKIVV